MSLEVTMQYVSNCSGCGHVLITHSWTLHFINLVRCLIPHQVAEGIEIEQILSHWVSSIWVLKKNLQILTLHQTHSISNKALHQAGWTPKSIARTNEGDGLEDFVQRMRGSGSKGNTRRASKDRHTSGYSTANEWEDVGSENICKEKKILNASVENPSLFSWIMLLFSHVQFSSSRFRMCNAQHDVSKSDCGLLGFPFWRKVWKFFLSHCLLP